MLCYNNADCIADVGAVRKVSIVNFYQLKNGKQKTRFSLSRHIVVVILMFWLTAAKLNDKQTTKLCERVLISSGKNIPLSINN